MSRKIIITTVALGTLALVLAFGAVAYRSVSAQSSTPVAPSTSTDTQTTTTQAAKPGRGMGDQAGNAELAAALGITEDELTAAYQKANSAAMAKAVELGLITQAQADQFNSSGKGGFFGGHSGGMLAQNGIDYDALLAEALGISVDALKAAQTTAYNARIDQGVTDGTLTQEQADLMKGRRALYADAKFQASMQSAFQAAVAQAVSDGVITQAQADLILKDTQGNIFGGPNGFGGPKGFGDFDGGHGRGGRGGHGEWDGNAPTNPATPAATP